MVGTGGLGSGIYLALEGNETLGREESRGAYLLKRRDFGKLHIVSHYVQVLLSSAFRVVPVGRVGNDPAGDGVKQELERVGVDVSNISTDDVLPTLFSVCFAYPNGHGGNLTTLNSASGAVTGEAVDATEPLFAQFQHRGIALVVPEVPVPAREALLALATRYRFLRAGSFVTAELREPTVAALVRQLDLMAINLDEAAAFARVRPGTAADDVVKAAVELARSEYEGLQLVVTAGRRGSWAWDGRTLAHDEGYTARVVNSAGAGDAHLAGCLVGLACGLEIHQANAFATVVSTLKVADEDTISWGIDGATVHEAASALGRQLPASVLERLRSSGRQTRSDGSQGDPVAWNIGTSSPVRRGSVGWAIPRPGLSGSTSDCRTSRAGARSLE
jgi:sugar/nucleoside kinase (ribokinase family)